MELFPALFLVFHVPAVPAVAISVKSSPGHLQNQEGQGDPRGGQDQSGGQEDLTKGKRIHICSFSILCSKQKSRTCPRDSVIFVANGWGEKDKVVIIRPRGKGFVCTFLSQTCFYGVLLYFFAPFPPAYPALSMCLRVDPVRWSPSASERRSETPERGGCPWGISGPGNNVFPRYSQSTQ